MKLERGLRDRGSSSARRTPAPPGRSQGRARASSAATRRRTDLARWAGAPRCATPRSPSTSSARQRCAAVGGSCSCSPALAKKPESTTSESPHTCENRPSAARTTRAQVYAARADFSHLSRPVSCTCELSRWTGEISRSSRRQGRLPGAGGPEDRGVLALSMRSDSPSKTRVSPRKTSASSISMTRARSSLHSTVLVHQGADLPSLPASRTEKSGRSRWIIRAPVQRSTPSAHSPSLRTGTVGMCP